MVRQGMLTLLLVNLIVCVLWTIQPDCTVLALAKSSDGDEFTTKNQRPRMRQNYVLRQEMGNDESDNTGDAALQHAPGPIEVEAASEELVALMVDYANMIRNEIKLLDNSVQPRTQKRGSLNTENNQEIENVPCSCEDGKKLKYLGEEYVPRTLESMYCNASLCPSPYSCRTRTHAVTVLRRRRYVEEVSPEYLPEDLNRKWVAIKEPVTVGCLCSKGYIYA